MGRVWFFRSLTERQGRLAGFRYAAKRKERMLMKICTWSWGVLPDSWTERPFGKLVDPHRDHLSLRGLGCTEDPKAALENTNRVKHRRLRLHGGRTTTRYWHSHFSSGQGEASAGVFLSSHLPPVKKAAVGKQFALGELPPSSSVASFAIWREITLH